MSTNEAAAATDTTKPDKPAPKAPRRGNTHVRKPSNTALRYAAPVLICASAMPAAEVAHLAWGHDGPMTAAMTAVAIGLTWFTNRTWHKRHEDTQALATTFAGAVSGWTVLGAVTDPFSHGMVNSWALGSIALSAAWHIRGHGLAAPHEADKRTRPDNGMGRFGQLVSSLKGAKVVSVSESPDKRRVSARIKLDKPTTAGQVIADKDAIASTASVGTDQVTIVRADGREDMVDVSVTVASPLGASLRWTPTPDSELGLSVADAPLIPGMRTDGRPVEVWMCGQDTTDTQESRILGHILCTGQTGSGKTETVRNLVVLGRDRRDFVPVVGDPEKFLQSFGDIRDAFAIAAVDEKQTRRLVRNIPDAVRYRAGLLGSLTRADGGTGYKQWVPECYSLHGIPLVFLDIEEAASVLDGDNDDFDKAVRTARSVGIKLCASLQTAIHSNIERKTRGQFAESLTHGAKELADAKFALSAGTIEAGADPVKWGGNFPGSLYAEVVGTPPAEWAIEARAFWISPEEKRRQLDRSKAAGHWAVLDPGTYAALSAGVVPDEPTVQIVGSATGAGKASVSDYPEFDFGDSVYINDEDSEEADVSIPLPPSRHAQPFQIGIPDPVRKMPTEEAQEFFDNRLRELEAAGAEDVSVADLADVPGLVGRERSWLYAQLTRCENSGRLRKVNGSTPLRWTLEKRMAINGHTLY